MEGLYKRIEYIDIFRALGIILMVMGHVGFGLKFYNFIHAFHMPMFFFISGFLFKRKNDDFVQFILKKAKSLLIPYFVFGIFHYLVWLLFKGRSIKPLICLFSVNTSGELPVAGALWFLTALFLTEMLYFIIDKYLSGQLKGLVVIAISLLGNMVDMILPFTLPYALGPAMVGVGLFHLGYLLHKYEETKFVNKIMNMSYPVWFVSTVLTIILIFMNGHINMRTGEYAIIPLFWINAFLAIIVLMNLSKYIYAWIGNKKAGEYLKCIGRNAIVYVCLNQLVITILRRIVDAIGGGFLSLTIQYVVILILALAALWFCCSIITKTGLRIFIGKSLKDKR